jgi:SOS-response transcriptional repressor LexA
MVYEFGSTDEVYNASRTDHGIEDGDVLLVRSEHAMR